MILLKNHNAFTSDNPKPEVCLQSNASYLKFSPVRPRNSFHALSINVGFLCKHPSCSTQVFWPPSSFLCSQWKSHRQQTACQLCAAVPGTHVAVDKPAVGTTQLTSPTSVEPKPTPEGSHFKFTNSVCS
jgi:hypothetical protein